MPATRTLQPVASYLLRLAALMTRHPFRIHIPRIDKTASVVDERVEQLKPSRFVNGPAKHVAAERQRRDIQTRISQASFFHHRPLRRNSIAPKSFAAVTHFAHFKDARYSCGL